MRSHLEPTSRPWPARQPAVALVSVLLLSGAAGCSLIIDSGQYVDQQDAGPADMGALDQTVGDASVSDAAPQDMSTTDQAAQDQATSDLGGVMCNGVTCAAGQRCRDNQLCVDCEQDTDCSSGLCDRAVGTCVDPVVDCSTVCADTCVPHPMGGMACVRCDRDGDGFVSGWPLCDGVAPLGAPRDCNDNDPQQFPGAAPICSDGFLQGCATPELDAVRAALGGGFAELGQVPAHRVVINVAAQPQLSVVARAGDYLGRQDDDPNAARWVFGMVRGGEAALHTVQYRGHNGTAFAFDTTFEYVSTRPGWPIPGAKTEAFAVDFFAGAFRYAAVGEIGSTRGAALMTDAPGAVIPSFAGATEDDFLPPLAIIGGTSARVVYRVQRATALPNQRRLVAHSSAPAPHPYTSPTTVVSDAPDFLLDAVGEHVFYTPNGALTGEVWDGLASSAVNTGTPVPSQMSGQARFSLDAETGQVVGILPYAAGVRVVSFTCPGSAFDNCESEVSGVQPLFQNLGVFDIQVHDGVLYLVSASGNTVVLDVATVGATLGLTRLTSQSVPLINSANARQNLVTVNSVETAFQQRSNYTELVVGAVVDTDTAGVFVMGTGVRACTNL